jgi:hypothetical protein
MRCIPMTLCRDLRTTHSLTKFQKVFEESVQQDESSEDGGEADDSESDGRGIGVNNITATLASELLRGLYEDKTWDNDDTKCSKRRCTALPILYLDLYILTLKCTNFSFRRPHPESK